MPLQTYVPFQSIVGAALTSFRSETALDQATMAKALGMSAANLSRIENGLGNLTVEQLFNSCRILDISPSRFVVIVEDTKHAMEAENIVVTYAKSKDDEVGYIRIARHALNGFLDRVTDLHSKLYPQNPNEYESQ